MTRRASGEGSIHALADGRLRGSVEVPSADGGRRRRYVYGATRREVADKLTRLRRAVADGTIATGPDMTVEAWLAHWLDTIAVLRTSTRIGYASKIRVRVAPYIGRVRLDRLTPEHLERLYAQLLEEGLSPATVTQVHRILHRALRVAEQRRRIGRSPAELVSPPAARHREAVALSREQAIAVLAAAATRRSAPRWQVGLAMGLRQGEALGLTWPAVDLAAGTLAVTTELVWHPYRHGCGGACQAQQTQRASGAVATLAPARRCPKAVSGRYVLEEPKSARSRRVLPMPPQLVDALKAWRRVQLEERLALGERWEGFALLSTNVKGSVPTLNSDARHSGLVDLVFAQPNGRPTGSRQDWGDWQEILAAAGAPRMGTHGGRHTTATLMLEAGESMKVVQDWLGHSSYQLTADVYSHVAMNLKRGAAESVGAALWGAPGSHIGSHTGGQGRS